ncbi:hypothetical protein SFUMM280S_09098 [Streptomyces fumanus]
MPTIAMGSSVAAGAVLPLAVSSSVPSSDSRRVRSSAAGVGWSKTRVAGSRRPVAVLSRLRRSRPVSESKPRFLKVVESSVSASEGRPSTAVTCSRIRFSRVRSRSASGIAASRCGSADPDGALGALLAVRRGGAGTTPLSIPVSVPSPARTRSAGRSNAAVTNRGSGEARAASKSCRPCSEGSCRTPSRFIRCRSAVLIAPVMPLASAHSPQAMEVAGSPSARRAWASASR